MTTIAADPKHLGARIGITAVLHTWGSAMTHHPHIHMIVPGGGLSLDGQRWISSRPAFLLPGSDAVKAFLYRKPATTSTRDSEAGCATTFVSVSSLAASSGMVMSGGASTHRINCGTCPANLPAPDGRP